MSRSLLPPAIALVLILSGGAALLLPEGQQVMRSAKSTLEEPVGKANATAHELLNDARPSAQLSGEELKERVSSASALTWSNDISRDQRAKLRGQIESDSNELNRRLLEEAQANPVRDRRPAKVPASLGQPPASVPLGPAKVISPPAIASIDQPNAKAWRNARDRANAKFIESSRSSATLRAGPTAHGIPMPEQLWESADADPPEMLPADGPKMPERHLDFR
jgi:hypothetical protein